jgi:NAD(P)-dependent dehydrogenase (short-subunit alcohol dehydrogenase family)
MSMSKYRKEFSIALWTNAFSKYALIKNLASQPENTVIGLVRNVHDTKARLSADGIMNVHVVQVTSIVDGPSLSQAAKAVEAIVGDAGLDYLINNAAYVSEVTGYTTLLD